MKIILGSSSKFRRMVLDEMGIAYEVITPDIDEKAIRFSDPEELVVAIAQAKADAVAQKVTEPALIITSDQVVVWNGEIREKPVDVEQAKTFIKSYSEHPAIIINAIVITNSATGARVSGAEAMHAWYLPIPDEIVEELANHEHAMQSAGALRFENPLMQKFLIHTDGDRASALGLPKKLLTKLLADHGYNV